MIWTKMARMMVDEQCCVSFGLCRSTAVGRHLRARGAPDRQPPAAGRSAPPAAALRPRTPRGIFEDFSLQRFLQRVSAMQHAKLQASLLFHLSRNRLQKKTILDVVLFRNQKVIFTKFSQISFEENIFIPKS